MGRQLTMDYLWHRRSFVLSLVYKDFKTRYAHSLLGLAWVVIEPVLLVVALSLIFGLIGRKGLNAGNTSFPVFFFTGVLPWNYFRHAIAEGPKAFLSDTSLM